MISQLGVQNVRLFSQQLHHFALFPLTVFCGTNSAGKSTLLKILPLLRQTQGINESYAMEEGRLRLTGSQVDLGTYGTFIAHGKAAQPMVLQIGVDFTMPLRHVKMLAPSVAAGIKTDDVPASVDAVFTFSAIPQLNPTEPDGEIKQAVLSNATFRVSLEGDSLLSWTVVTDEDPTDDEGNEESYRISLPREYFGKRGGFSMLEVPPDKGDGMVSFACGMRGILPNALIGRLKENRRDNQGGRDRTQSDATPAPERWGVFPLPPEIMRANEVILNALSSTHYIGPLRSPAKRYYVAHLDSAPGLDSAGEFMPYVLKDPALAHKRVWNLMPGAMDDPKEEPLMRALNQWMHYLRTGDTTVATEELNVATTRGVLVEMSVLSPDGYGAHAIADSGFGYSQVLPILVRGLLTTRDGTLVIEQPELHLNPSLQVRLAQFLISMAMAGKQVIVETHSEHIVNSIRVAAAEDHTGRLANRSKVYFLDVGPSGSIVHDLSIEKDGTVPDWPPHFFGEAAQLAGRLLRAQRFHRNGLRGTGNE